MARRGSIRPRVWLAPLVVALAAGELRGEEAAAALDERLELRLTAPLAAPRNSFFYATLGQPLARDARTVGEGSLQGRVRWSYSRSTMGVRNRFDGVLWEWARLEVTLGLAERVDLYAAARISGWDERRDVFRLFRDGDEFLVVEGEQRKVDFGVATSRHENLSEVVLGLQVQWWRGEGGRSGLSTSLQVKSPEFRRADLTNSGTTDLAATALVSLELAPRLLVHGTLGIVVPLGEARIFRDQGIERHLPPFPQGTLSVTWAPADWLALGASLEASGVAFHEPDLLKAKPFAGSLGARLRRGPLWIEVGAGAGLTSKSVDTLVWVEVGFLTPPLWGEPPEPTER